MLKIAVVTRYFPSSAEPWQGRSAYQTLRVLAREAEVRVFYPNARYPSWLKPRSRSYDKLDADYSPPEVKASYYDFPALPLISRPLNGWMAARVLLPHIRNFAPDLLFSFFLYPDGYAALKIGKASLSSGGGHEHWIRYQQDRRSHFCLAHARRFARSRFSDHGERRST